MKILLILLISMSLFANIGNIMAIKGSAQIHRSGTTLNATNGVALLKSDTIDTAEHSRVQVMLKDTTVITIGQNSSFNFEDFSFDGTKKSKVKMRAIRGFFRSVTGKIGKIAPERFTVKTESATIGIRGTDFSGNILKGKEVFKCYQGKIFVKFKGVEHNINYGSMIELVGGKYKVKKFDLKIKKYLNNREYKKILEKVKRKILSMDPASRAKIINRVKSDIINISKDTQLTLQPFKIDTKAEDRKISY